MSKPDFYELLGIKRNADADDIKKAYRTLAMKHHPDRNPGDADAEKKFKEISHAYEILKDEQKRAAYDRFGHAAFEQGGHGGHGAGGNGFASGFADIFDEMFGDFAHGGGRRGPGAQSRGSDLRYNMQISLEEAFAGKKTNIRVPSSIPCGECKGSGAAGGSAPVTCATCHGHGKVRSQSGFFTVERTCPSCHGNGKVIKEPCHNCGGSGRVKKEKTLSVAIPPGVEDGARIRLSGEGEAGLRGAPTGDLYIFLAVSPHRIFQRDGADIYCRAPIPMSTAALGGSIEVPTIQGNRARVAIPPGTQTGQQFRLKSKGMSVLNSKVLGDMFVQTVVETPVNLTAKQKELLKEFTKESPGETHSPEAHGFFSKVKELWEDIND
ncbi:MAG: molecular chaperone DnaJ [Rhodospirillales bacterium RIFCSPLOWO2_12_FULL_58_28]|nr:MAG: molecular chaperone DnaJ [Rhodospirillales bacterium RIFCSPLOWO2_02_FULL_58_16]OHC79941.1 MAG: molecular chaperone DnaJ [Rhodospirillales bacterium RIFCSPLOWO2_12_FULL_58_28]